VALAEDVAVIHDPEIDKAFHIEQHGVDFIPESERWAKPRDLFGMWAGASTQVEYFIYGAVLMTFGFSFGQALSIIIIGNLSYFLLGVCSLQGPDAGTTVFGINRASYGPNGSRIISFFNWITQVGFEIEGLLLIVGAGLVLSGKAGFNPGDPAKVAMVIGAVVVQFVLPFLGHATIVKVLRALILPFVVLFIVLLIFVAPHAHTSGKTYADWQVYFSGLAFTITLSGLGWTECGNDYSRYLPRKSSTQKIILWIFLGTAVPEILIMTLGAVTGTLLTSVGTSANAFAPFLHQSIIAPWFVDVFLIFCIIQLFAINSLDLYSSGVTLQAMGIKVKRYQAVVIDSVFCLAITMFAIFNASFSTYLKDFVDVVIVWIAPWVAIYVVDWVLRRYRYVPSELQKTGKDGMYYRNGGYYWPALIAQLVGMVAAMAGLNPTFNVPNWLISVSWLTGSNGFTRADFSIYMGIFVGGVVYLVLAYRDVKKQADQQDELLKAEGLF
jgi:purine-cytosine permease-like protein